MRRNVNEASNNCAIAIEKDRRTERLGRTQGATKIYVRLIRSGKDVIRLRQRFPINRLINSLVSGRAQNVGLIIRERGC